MMTYVFVRSEGFYILDLIGNEDARENAELNPGTIRVEDIFGRVIWEAPKDAVH